jgi:DNA primase (bacterial type)
MLKKEKRLVDLPVFSEGVLDVFTKIYPAQWLEEGISAAAMDKFNILFSISQNKIIIPHYNVKGELVGIRGRALNEWEVENVGKYMPIKVENIWYNHRLSLNLYGLNANKENIKKNGYAILVEGEKSVMQAESFKRDNCTAAVCGSNLNKFQIEILMRECSPREIIIAFDNEEEKGKSIYFDKLYAMCKKYSNYADFSFIYDKYNLTKKKDSPFDEGEETFNKLLEKRVKVK